LSSSVLGDGRDMTSDIGLGLVLGVWAPIDPGR
jgi:hypothetical protein